MLTYYITIIDRETKTQKNLVKNEDDIDKTITSELGGWNNLLSACTSGMNWMGEEYFMAGTTRDDSKVFSILCIKS